MRFALPDEAPYDASKLLAPPPRVLYFSGERSSGHLQQLANSISPAMRHMWLACGVMGTYHTVLQPSSARMAILGMCFVLPASRTLANHGVKKSVAKFLPPNPLAYLVATAAASAGIYVGLNSNKN